MNTIHPKIYFLILVLFSNLSLGAVKDVGAIVGAINQSLAGGSASAPKYTVAQCCSIRRTSLQRSNTQCWK